MKNFLIVLSLALFFVGCGGSSTSNVDDIESNQSKNSRILQVISVGDDIYRTDYEYNSQNLLAKKSNYYNNVLSDTETFVYNDNKQLISKSKIGVVALYVYYTTYNYGDMIYSKTNIPILISSDVTYSFSIHYSESHIDYNYDIDEQNMAFRLNSTNLYYKSRLEEDREIVTQYIYDDNNRVIEKDNTIYSYNDFGQLVSSSSNNFYTLYNYDEQNHLSFYENYLNDILVGTTSYKYENGDYDDSRLKTAFVDEEPYISLGMY